MKIKELAEKYNGEAELHIIVNNRSVPYEVLTGTSEGCTPKNCDSVSLFVEGMNSEEVEG